jgi:hypothetical protein
MGYNSAEVFGYSLQLLGIALILYLALLIAIANKKNWPIARRTKLFGFLFALLIAITLFGFVFAYMNATACG